MIDPSTTRPFRDAILANCWGCGYFGNYTKGFDCRKIGEYRNPTYFEEFTAGAKNLWNRMLGAFDGGSSSAVKK